MGHLCLFQLTLYVNCCTSNSIHKLSDLGTYILKKELAIFSKYIITVFNLFGAPFKRS